MTSKVLFALLAFVLWVFPVGQADAGHKLFSVIFEVHTDATGAIDTVKISKVIDPASGSTDAVSIDVPDRYVVAARSLMSKKQNKPNDLFYTYYFYDPGQPDRADIDPQKQ